MTFNWILFKNFTFKHTDVFSAWNQDIWFLTAIFVHLYRAVAVDFSHWVGNGIKRVSHCLPNRCIRFCVSSYVEAALSEVEGWWYKCAGDVGFWVEITSNCFDRQVSRKNSGVPEVTCSGLVWSYRQVSILCFNSRRCFVYSVLSFFKK